MVDKIAFGTHCIYKVYILLFLSLLLRTTSNLPSIDMPAFMVDEVSFGSECPRTVAANERLLSGMCPYMVSQTGSLGELSPTALNWAAVRSLVRGVLAEMQSVQYAYLPLMSP